MKIVSIGAARKLGEDHDARGIVVIVVDQDGYNYAATSWGKTKADCDLMHKHLDRICDAFEDSAIDEGMAR